MSLLGNHSGGASSQMGLHTSGGRIPYEHLVFGDGFAFIVSARVKVVMRRIVAPLTITSDVATANEMTTESKLSRRSTDSSVYKFSSKITMLGKSVAPP